MLWLRPAIGPALKIFSPSRQGMGPPPRLTSQESRCAKGVSVRGKRDQVSDEALAGRAAEGDAAAFRRLVERHYDRAFRVAFAVSGRREEAEDLAQEIWASMPRRLRSWRGEARFTTWLHAVALNAARDALRRRAVGARAVAVFADLQALERGAASDAADRLDWLTEALGGLGAELRETAALVLGEELSHAEAARALGVAESTVSWRMSEIRKKLRAQVAGAAASSPSPASGSLSGPAAGSEV